MLNPAGDRAAPLHTDVAIQPGDVVIHVDRSGRIVYWNAEAAKVFGYSRVEATGKPLEFVFPAAGAGPDRARFDVDRVMAGRDFAGGFQCLRKNGDKLAVYMYATVGRDAAGKPAGVVCVAREVTHYWRAEQAVRASEEKYGMLLRATSDAVVLLSRRGRILEANPAACRITGYPAEKLLGMTALELVAPERRREAEGLFRKLVTDRQVGATLDFRRASGETVAVEYSASTVETEGQLFYFAIARDVTERVRAERQARESGEKYRRIFSAVRDGMYLETLDGAIVEVNDSACRMLGYTREELLRKRVEELVPKESRAGLALIRDALMQRGGFSGEGVNLRRDGSEVPVDISCSLVDLDGQMFALVLVRDATERLQAARSLRESEANFRALADNAGDGILIVSGPDGRLVYANPYAAAVTGYTPSELLRLGIEKVVHPEEVPKLLDRYRRRLQGEAVLSPYETRILRRDGSEVEVELAAARTVWQGQPADLAIVRDVSERKRAEAELRSMADTAMELVRFPETGDLFDFICSRLKDFVGDAVFAVNAYDDERDILRVYRVGGISPKKLAQLGKAVGAGLTGMSFIGLPAAVKQGLASGRLVKIEEGLFGVFFHQIPEPLCRQIEQMTDIKEAYSIGLRRGERLFGNITILPRKAAKFSGTIIETFASQASIALERRQAEAALKESQRILATLMSNLPGMAYRCKNDPDWTMEFASEGFFALTGYRPDELVGEGKTAYGELIHHADRSWMDDEIRAALAAREPFELTYRLNTAGGQKWVWEQGRGVYDEQGKLVAFEGFITDITKRKLAEEELRQSEKHYRTLVETIQDGVYQVDTGGRFVFVNDVVIRRSGQSAEWHYNHSCFDLIRPKEQQKARATFEAVVRGESPSPYELTYTAASGETMTVEISVRPVLGDSGKVIGALGISRDVTERRAREAMLSESEERYRRLFELSPDGVAIHQDGKLVLVNPAAVRLLGYDAAEELVGQPVLEQVHPDEREKAAQRIRAAIAEGKAAPLAEERFRRKDGNYVWVEVVNSPFVWEGRSAVLVLARDISEKKGLAGGPAVAPKTDAGISTRGARG